MGLIGVEGHPPVEGETPRETIEHGDLRESKLTVQTDERESQGQGGPNGDRGNGDEHTGTYGSIKEEDIQEREDFALQIEGLEIHTDDLTNEKLHQYAVMSALKRGNRRFCSHCQLFKPERAHHCRQCGTCVLKMDHHCPWVNNCVGFYNYKYFFTMILYAGIPTLH